MPLPPAQNHRISKADAVSYTRRYREHAGPKAEHAAMFPRDCYEAILKQDGCVGIRIYFGRGTDQKMSPVLVGVDMVGNDMVDGDLMQNSFPCPPVCPKGSILNG